MKLMKYDIVNNLLCTVVVDDDEIFALLVLAILELEVPSNSDNDWTLTVPISLLLVESLLVFLVFNPNPFSQFSILM